MFDLPLLSPMCGSALRGRVYSESSGGVGSDPVCIPSLLVRIFIFPNCSRESKFFYQSNKIQEFVLSLYIMGVFCSLNECGYVGNRVSSWESSNSA